MAEVFALHGGIRQPVYCDMRHAKLLSDATYCPSHLTQQNSLQYLPVSDLTLQ